MRQHRALVLILVLAAAARIVGMFTVGNIHTDFYWEYGELARNMHAGNGYAIFHFQGDSLEHRFSPTAHPYISAYMPPAYAAFLYPFFWITDNTLRTVSIYAVHILLACAVVVLLYRLTDMWFGNRAAVLAAAAAALLPEFIYATYSFTPTILFHAAILLMFLLMARRESTAWNAVLLGALAAAMIYMRSEFALYALMIVAALAFERRWRAAAIVAGTIAVLILPWTIRTSLAFGRPVLLSTNAGLQLYRGNSDGTIGDWGNDSTLARLRRYRDDPRFEIRMNDMYVNDALAVMRADPLRTVTRTGAKLFHLWVFNPNDERSLHPAYLIPWLAVLGFAVAGLFAGARRSTHRYVMLYLIATSIAAAVFLALPRYQTMMKIALLPFAAHGMLVTVRRLRPGNRAEDSRGTGNNRRGAG